MSLDGRCLFFLEGTRQKVGVIPFSAEVQIGLETVGTYLKGECLKVKKLGILYSTLGWHVDHRLSILGRVSITRLTFSNGIEFFRLTAEDLDGLRKTTKTALENMANSVLGAGIPLSASPPR